MKTVLEPRWRDLFFRDSVFPNVVNPAHTCYGKLTDTADGKVKKNKKNRIGIQFMKRCFYDLRTDRSPSLTFSPPILPEKT